jgi:hypothetical protein
MKRQFGIPEHTHTHTHTQVCEGVVKIILKEITWDHRRRIDEIGGCCQCGNERYLLIPCSRVLLEKLTGL